MSTRVDNQEKTTKAPSLYEKNKLRIAGALNGFGDITLLLDGYKKEYDDNGQLIDKRFTKLAGWLYTIGAGVITLFGSVDKNAEVLDISKRTAEFLKSKGSTLSENLESTRILQQGQSNTGNFLNKLRRHSAQIMLWFYTLGAGALFAGGIRDYRNASKAGEKKPIGDLLVGGMSLLVKSASFLMPEKAATSETEIENGKRKGLIGWIKEKPMRLFGYGSMLTEAFWGFRAYEKFKAGKKWKLSAATGSAYALSDVVIATTNKDAANAIRLDETEQSQLENMVAETIAHQASEKQDQLITESAAFLEKQAGVNGNAQELRQSIMQRVESMRGSDWAERSANTAQLELTAQAAR